MIPGPYVFFLSLVVVILLAAIIIAKAKKDEKARAIALSEKKAEVLEKLGGIHHPETTDASGYLDGFQILSKGFFGVFGGPKGYFDGLSVLVRQVKAHQINVLFGDYEYHIGDGDGGSDTFTQTVFIVEVSGYEFDPVHTRPRRFFDFLNIPSWNPVPLEEIVTDLRIRDLVERNKWEIETNASVCLIYRRQRRHDPDEYGQVLDEAIQVVDHLIS